MDLHQTRREGRPASPTPGKVKDLGYRWASCGRGGALYFHWRTTLLPPRIVEGYDMTVPGRPTTPPSWYRRGVPSPIEDSFSAELDGFASAIEHEHWFGDKEKHHRYRVDFLLEDARLIVELDGWTNHKTPEQIQADARRQRYLTRCGYTVIRFTGREIRQDASDCVNQLRTIYRERMQRVPARRRVLYVDYQFLHRRIRTCLASAQCRFPDRSFEPPPIEQVILRAVEWLHARSFISVFIFHERDDSGTMLELNGQVRDFQKGEVRFNLEPVCEPEFLAFALMEHIQDTAHLFDDVFAIIDDPLYVNPEILAIFERARGRLLRKGNSETSFRGTEWVKIGWQNVDYVIEGAMGLQVHEM